ncbi:MAG: c-type cytochrome [Planctomycetota bacterium]|nr:c-type cytochrome [Planctomycetota bacterium]
MISINRILFLCLFTEAVLLSIATGQHHDHHGSHQISKPEPPKIFLDKSPRIVAYQLKRLDNQRLLMVERDTNDSKYVPVFQAILGRAGMTAQYRQEAVSALAVLLDESPEKILMKAIEEIDEKKSEGLKTAEQLIEMLINQPNEALIVAEQDIQMEIANAKESVRIAAFCALKNIGKGKDCFALAGDDPEKLVPLLKAFQFSIEPNINNDLLRSLTRLISNSNDQTILEAAIEAMAFVRAEPEQRCEVLVPLIRNETLRDAAVRTLLSIPPESRPNSLSKEMADLLVQYAENTPPAERTSEAFTNAMQLADESFAALPSNTSKSYRSRMDAVSVRMIRIRTVEEEMRYDLPYFAVQAGKPIQIILENHDLMPHNLVLTTPGSLKAVAQAGLNAGPKGGTTGLAYVPDSAEVLHATDLVPSDTQTRLTFDAPTEPGEYPYVCTFPQHWYRMYGVMVVVEDLDQWQKNPREPENPIGNNRSFVQAWTVEDLRGDLESGLLGRSKAIGQRLFDEASCRGCHQIAGEGGVIGPDLSKVVAKWKGNRAELLREILEPSHRVDEAYQMQKILTVDGQTLTGIRLSEDDEKVVLMTNPEAKEPITLLQDDIEIMAPSSVSMMPKALLDQYTKDEIFEIMAYIESSQTE